MSKYLENLLLLEKVLELHPYWKTHEVMVGTIIVMDIAWEQSTQMRANNGTALGSGEHAKLAYNTQ